MIPPTRSWRLVADSSRRLWGRSGMVALAMGSATHWETTHAWSKDVTASGDRLLGIVELSSDQASERGHSEELYRAAVSQVERDARQIAFADAVSIKGLRRLSLLNAFLLVVACILWALFPGAFNNAWQRWIQPQSDIQRYTLVRVTLDQDNYLMIRGEPFTIQAGVEYDSLWKPRKVSASVDTGYQIEGEVVDGRITLEIPGQFKKIIPYLDPGRQHHWRQALNVLRPTLTHRGPHSHACLSRAPNEHRRPSIRSAGLARGPE